MAPDGFRVVTIDSDGTTVSAAWDTTGAAPWPCCRTSSAGSSSRCTPPSPCGSTTPASWTPSPSTGGADDDGTTLPLGDRQTTARCCAPPTSSPTTPTPDPTSGKTPLCSPGIEAPHAGRPWDVDRRAGRYGAGFGGSTGFWGPPRSPQRALPFTTVGHACHMGEVGADGGAFGQINELNWRERDRFPREYGLPDYGGPKLLSEALPKDVADEIAYWRYAIPLEAGALYQHLPGGATQHILTLGDQRCARSRQSCRSGHSSSPQKAPAA